MFSEFSRILLSKVIFIGARHVLYIITLPRTLKVRIYATIPLNKNIQAAKEKPRFLYEGSTVALHSYCRKRIKLLTFQLRHRDNIEEVSSFSHVSQKLVKTTPGAYW